MAATVLYIDYTSLAIEEKRQRQLNGVLRFAKACGWNVRTLSCDDFRPSALPAILARLRPIGCIDDCSDGHHELPPRLFGDIPVIYLDPTGRLPWHGARTVVCDNAAVASRAFRELSIGLPPSYAVIGFFEPRQWARERVSAFCALCKEAGKPCAVFPYKAGEGEDARIARLSRWISSLPLHCAVFAVNDPAAREAMQAFRIAIRPVPRTATLVGVDALWPPSGGNPCPRFSSVRLDFDLAGYLAAKMLSASKRVATFGPLLVERLESTRGFGRRKPDILKAVDIIREKACGGLTAADLADLFPCSRNLFERRFREAMGRSVLKEILDVRMENALSLLSRPDVPIGAVASFCGFSSDIALRKLFRQRMGVSMRQWRSSHLR